MSTHVHTCMCECMYVCMHMQMCVYTCMGTCCTHDAQQTVRPGYQEKNELTHLRIHVCNKRTQFMNLWYLMVTWFFIFFVGSMPCFSMDVYFDSWHAGMRCTLASVLLRTWVDIGALSPCLWTTTTRRSSRSSAFLSSVHRIPTRRYVAVGKSVKKKIANLMLLLYSICAAHERGVSANVIQSLFLRGITT